MIGDKQRCLCGHGLHDHDPACAWSFCNCDAFELDRHATEPPTSPLEYVDVSDEPVVQIF